MKEEGRGSFLFQKFEKVLVKQCLTNYQLFMHLLAVTQQVRSLEFKNKKLKKLSRVHIDIKKN